MISSFPDAGNVVSTLYDATHSGYWSIWPNVIYRPSLSTSRAIRSTSKSKMPSRDWWRWAWCQPYHGIQLGTRWQTSVSIWCSCSYIYIWFTWLQDSPVYQIWAKQRRNELHKMSYCVPWQHPAHAITSYTKWTKLPSQPCFHPHIQSSASVVAYKFGWQWEREHTKETLQTVGFYLLVFLAHAFHAFLAMLHSSMQFM